MFIESLIDIFQPILLLIILLGVSLGIIWGALPGLSTTMAMALLIGFTSTMEQNIAICFMLSVYTGSVFGGAISAILINIPGTPDAVPTMIEGHALAKKGEAGTALGTAIFGSFIGNWIGILILIFLMPFLIAIALNFKSWEMFLLSIIGISVCGTMCSGELPIKGWIVGWIGILIAMVGIDPIYGIERFTFNNPNFYDGFNYIPILIGLFGICEIVKTLPNKNKSPIPEKVGRLFLPLKKLFGYVKTSIRSGLIGTFIGALPGAGANVASFLSYDIGKKRAKPEEKKLWGKGSYEAIVSAEVANNANIGGSILPTLALGIPGNAAAAALLAALTMKNVVVGPTIDIDHPGLVYFIYAVLLIANFFMYAMAIALVKPCIKLFSLSRGLLLPLIIPVCVLGAYAARLNLYDLWIMFFAGILGYILSLCKYPTAPIVLGVILAPMADENLRRSLMIFSEKDILYFFQQYTGLILLLIFIFIIFDGLRRLKKT